ncbi:FDXHR family putative zinc-binding protein [Nonomuraea sp. SYSU D8015]|uniref:FDXHR family putative zinc-binding protein n=1 Tax=Nonomuraea sp. SYSU D8015 TaxID=2593644 RepID=UPI003FA609DF
MITCGGCPAEWGGETRAHCSGCHRTFTGITAFDVHHKGGECWPPRQVGLEALHTSGNQILWGKPREGELPAAWVKEAANA